VWLNDWADEKVDRLKRQMFPTGCSPKTIPDGLLSARALGMAGALASLLALGVAAGVAWYFSQPGYLLAGAVCWLLFALYSLPPVALNYRGGGELLEALGVGLALPWFSAYVYSGTAWHPWYFLLLGHFWLALASALASGLSDEDSDRAGGKRTFTTWLGNGMVRNGVQTCTSLAVLFWALTPWLLPEAPRWLGLPAALVLSLQLNGVRQRALKAVHRAFSAQSLYKGALHAAIWSSSTALGLTLLWWAAGRPL
jgi:1,4-dihydroxy-2-naphthoate octaprenyltransferase/chlorophyll synthase